MTGDRIRSIVPMFGGGDRYVETLDAILEVVVSAAPSTDELVGWHMGEFENVASRDSIMRRVRYLENAGFISEGAEGWQLGRYGREYWPERELETLLEIMCGRNVGLRSLLYALSAGPMTIEEISDQQLNTHPELGWDPEQTDMAKQRANWLRSMGLVEKHDREYALTEEGREFTEGAVAEWADSEWTPSHGDEFSALTYETTSYARTVDPEFRATVLSRYNRTCPVSGVDHPGLLDVAHVLSWRDYPDYRADLGNVLPLSKTHHAAFDREFFTINREYRIQVNPGFETASDVLRRTIVDRAGDRLGLGEQLVSSECLQQYNETLEWV